MILQMCDFLMILPGVHFSLIVHIWHFPMIIPVLSFFTDSAKMQFSHDFSNLSFSGDSTKTSIFLRLFQIFISCRFTQHFLFFDDCDCSIKFLSQWLSHGFLTPLARLAHSLSHILPLFTYPCPTCCRRQRRRSLPSTIFSRHGNPTSAFKLIMATWISRRASEVMPFHYTVFPTSQPNFLRGQHIVSTQTNIMVLVPQNRFCMT